MANEKTITEHSKTGEPKAGKGEEPKASKRARAEGGLITIKNVSKRMRTFNLAGEHMRDHEHHGYKRLSRISTTHDPKTGNVAYAKERITVPSSLMIPAGAAIENLPANIESCDEVQNAKRAGWIKIVPQEGRIDTNPPADEAAE